MNNNELSQTWNELKSTLRQKFESLTENDLLFNENKKEEMIEKLQSKLGKTKQEIRDIIAGI